MTVQKPRKERGNLNKGVTRKKGSVREANDRNEGGYRVRL